MITEVVEKVLKTDKRARKDDEYLVYKVVEEIYPEQVDKSFREVMLNAREINLNVDSIRRARQKLQAKNKNLVDYEMFQIRQARQKEIQKSI